MTKPASKLGSDLRKPTFAFLEKLTEDDAAPGLHIEPIAHSRDPRVRTGRVTRQYRAVLFRLDGPTQPTYVFVGVWNHDEAIKRAQRSELTVNPVNGVSEVHLVEDRAVADQPPTRAYSVPAPSAPPILGYTHRELLDLGLAPDLADRAARATSEDELLDLAGAAVEWQGLALLDLSAGTPVEDVKQKLGLELVSDTPAPGEATDADVLRGFEHPAAKVSYTYIEDNEELRRVIEEGDYGAWRVFLHPEQRHYAYQPTSGSFRLSGGAGTGKTVVLVHRAADLAGRASRPRVLLTTFTTNLALELRESLRRLDGKVPQATSLGATGVYVSGLDAIASAVIMKAGSSSAQARAAVLGSEVGGLARRLDSASAWQAAIEAGGEELPSQLRSAAFLEAEYGEVVLPHRIIELADYLKVRRPGRGVRLNRGERAAVWKVVESYRLGARATGAIDFREAAAIAAAQLDVDTERGNVRPFDHVLVDEGQDLSPTHWLLIRALVGAGPDDVFIAEDSHQRIYGRKITLKAFGINIVGRSRRLSLNYRTTAQNLRFALRVLDPGIYSDLEDEPETAAYRSARGGPEVILRPLTSLTEELDAAAAQVKQWVNQAAHDDQPKESIAVLVRDRFHRDRVVSGLAERGVTVRPVDREAIAPGAPVVMTMHRAKGTEFRDVLLFGVSAASMPKGLAAYDYAEDEAADARLRERSLLYVAATRARDQLVVSWSRESSPLLPTDGQ